MTLRALGTLALASLAGLFVAACQDDGPSLTGATSVTPDVARLETTAASASHSGSSGSSAEDDTSEDDTSDDSSTDDDSDDASEDDESDDDSDDVSEDDESDDDSIDDDESEDAGESEVNGLFFGTEPCPTADCVVALRIKDTLVVVTSETEIVNQAAGESLVSPLELEALVVGYPGLPMRAAGSSESGVLVAQKLRIDDEIRATGVVADAPGCDFGLAVQLVELCFGLSPGMTPPTTGSTVRVEGLVPGDFSLPFLATRIEPSDD
jgi:hypothetical protein